MKDRFLAGYEVGIIAIVLALAVDSEWYITMLICVITYVIGYAIAGRLQV